MQPLVAVPRILAHRPQRVRKTVPCIPIVSLAVAAHELAHELVQRCKHNVLSMPFSKLDGKKMEAPCSRSKGMLARGQCCHLACKECPYGEERSI